MNEHFTSYTSITLAGEDSFIRWVRHGEGDAEWRNWVARHAEKQITVEEARKIVLSLTGSAIGDLSPSGKTELWGCIHESIQCGTQQRPKKHLKPLWTWGLAAAATLALFVWISNLTASEKLMAKAGDAVADDDAGQALRALCQRLPDLRRGADVDTPRGLRGDHHARRLSRLPRPQR